MFKNLYLLLFLMGVSFMTNAQCEVSMAVSSTNVTCNGANNGTITVEIDPSLGLHVATISLMPTLSPSFVINTDPAGRVYQV
jgi:hypothetical protein